MYSVKPGRGPSAMGAIGGVFAILFGLFWIGQTRLIGAPPFFVLFGVGFVLMAIGGVIYNLHNATQKNRMSTFDITTDREESDPIATALGHTPPASSAASENPSKPAFCPYCGTRVKSDYEFCPRCGKEIQHSANSSRASG